ncbi:odorant receptor 4-like [Anopheles ziemanni]|uniref:odorant receptor 4-like n=1 Tax=Anopheles coustani TaxID=139045 RepID=UPI0026598174|nr:odorant receptor 4-like [Anopheles coustani]XP_058178255.1 odorant receptor 4-like [Anopheles ziemanni]
MQSIRRRIDRFKQQDLFVSRVVFVKENFAKLKVLGVYRGARDGPFFHRMVYYVPDIFFVLQIATIVWDLAGVLDDIGLFGDDMCILTGLVMMLVKKWHCIVSIERLDECIEQFQLYFERYMNSGEQFVDRIRRQKLQEVVLLYFANALAVILGGTLILHALLSNGESFILRARYPFNTATPLGYGFVFLCQAFLVSYVLFNVVYFDSVGSLMLSQLSLLFQLHRMEFEAIGEGLLLPPVGPLHGDDAIRLQIHKLIESHQQLLQFGDRVKRLYEPNIMAQFVCSMVIICLTAFELMFFKGDLMQMFRFGAYMVTGFFQIFVWSFFGNRVTATSTSIHEAISTSNWIVLNDRLKKDLRFTMMRAQKPFVIDVYWLFPLTYETFIAILSRSYSMFTLLRTMIE